MARCLTRRARDRRRSLSTFALPALVALVGVGACADDPNYGTDGGGDTGGGGGSGGGGGGPTGDTTPHTYTASDPNITYVGRIDFTTNATAPRFALGGTYVTARFKGTGATVRLKDELRYGKFRNYYDAIVDGKTVMKISPNDDLTMFEYRVASGLPYGEHTLKVVKRTEPNVGLGFFIGFTFDGVILPPAPAPAHRMEFIGDSITSGAGVDAPDKDPQCLANDGYGLPAMNADEGYGPVAARMLDAEYHVVGVSGIGLVRNYVSDAKNGDIRPMPEVYDLVMPQLPTSAANTWDTTQYQPDVVVAALGTNDFSPGDNPYMTSAGMPADARPIMQVSTFVTAYVAFIDTLRGYYPNAHVFVISSPMLGDAWPTSLYKSRTDQIASLGMVESHYAAAGDAKVHKFVVTQQAGTGCGTHPSAAQQSATGTELAAFIKTTMGW